MRKIRNNKAFTIVELVVVIAVIGILSTIVIVGYGSWRTSTATSSLKSDLGQAAASMESARTFSLSYPPNLPTEFQASDKNTITPYLSGLDDKSFCIDGVSSAAPSVPYYIDDLTQANGATPGTCDTRGNALAPSSVTGVNFTTAATDITINWTLASPNHATQYLAQCASDPAFIAGLIQDTVTGGTTVTATLSGASAESTYYCRVQAKNENGQSDWSSTSSGNTQQSTCADSGRYGTYPDCYSYDSLPIASSIEGYWTTEPSGYLFEDGREVSRTTYADLFAVIGEGYGGGDGETTFNLPDSRGRTGVNQNVSDVEFTSIGQKTGSKTESLTIAQLPAHFHTIDTPRWLGADDLSGGTMYAESSSTNNRRPDRPFSSSGGGLAHNNIQPSITKVFAIKYRIATGTGSSLPAGASISGYWAAPPSGYFEEDGSAVSRTTYASLFQSIGTTQGAGNESTTFNLPDSRGRASVNISTTDSEFDSIGEKPGSKREALTIAQMPSHNHTITTPRWLGVDVLSGSSIYAEASNTRARRPDRPTSTTGDGETHNNIQRSITKKYAIKHAAASGSQPAATTGTSISGYFTTVPGGYLREDGSAVSRTTYADLFQSIGIGYGPGDGETTFNVPDSRGRLGVNRSVIDTEFDGIDEKVGAKSHVLTLAEMPSHNHTIDTPRWYGADSLSGGTMYMNAPNTSQKRLERPTSFVGGDSAHNNIQPSIVKLFLIKY